MCNLYTTQICENIKFKRKVFHPSLLPMDFISMDLIGEFHPSTSHGHHYALTVVCMLTGFTWCITLKTKTAEEVAKAYLDHIYSLFGGSVKILADRTSRTNFSRKSSPNWARNSPYIHHHTDHRAMGRSRDSIDS